MNHCDGHGGNVFFISSECRHEPGKTGSMQAYRTFCHRIIEDYDPWTGESNGTFAHVPSFKYGHCQDNEICVNGLGAQEAPSGHRVATCVSIEYFTRMIQYSQDRGNGSRSQTALEGSMASMMVSKPDASTPLEVDNFAVEPVIATDHMGADGEGATAVQSVWSRCRDCVELETQQFEKGTEGLTARATLLTTGAAAGILWVFLLSG